MDTDNSGVLRHAKVGMNLGKGGLRMGQRMVAQKSAQLMSRQRAMINEGIATAKGTTPQSKQTYLRDAWKAGRQSHDLSQEAAGRMK